MTKKGSKFTNYSPTFKLQVVEDYLSGQSGGLEAVTRHYGLKLNSQVRNWVKKYCKNPDLLRKDLRGTRSAGYPKTRNLEEMTQEEQNAYLRMENAILKNLRTLHRK